MAGRPWRRSRVPPGAEGAQAAIGWPGLGAPPPGDWRFLRGLAWRLFPVNVRGWGGGQCGHSESGLAAKRHDGNHARPHGNGRAGAAWSPTLRGARNANCPFPKLSFAFQSHSTDEAETDSLWSWGFLGLSCPGESIRSGPSVGFPDLWKVGSLILSASFWAAVAGRPRLQCRLVAAWRPSFWLPHQPWHPRACSGPPEGRRVLCARFLAVQNSQGGCEPSPPRPTLAIPFRGPWGTPEDAEDRALLQGPHTSTSAGPLHLSPPQIQRNFLVSRGSPILGRLLGLFTRPFPNILWMSVVFVYLRACGDKRLRETFSSLCPVTAILWICDLGQCGEWYAEGDVWKKKKNVRLLLHQLSSLFQCSY